MGLALMTSSLPPRHDHSHTGSATSLHSNYSGLSPVTSGHPTGAANLANYSYFPPYGAPASPFSPRNQQRFATAKSAILIYCALLGLSPILKSLTKSTTSDSIWALSCWLMCINVFFFDYGGGVGVKWVLTSCTPSALSKIWADNRKIPRLSLHKRRLDGLYSAGLSPAQHHSRLFPDSLLDRSLRSLSSVPAALTTQILAWTSPAYHITRHGSRRRGRRDGLWWRLEGSRRRRGTRRLAYMSGHGRVQLVVDRTAEV